MSGREEVSPARIRIAFIGCAGIPNRYGGFESFAEHVSPELAKLGCDVIVTCDASLYPDRNECWNDNVTRKFIGIRANGALSPLHDLAAYLSIAWRVDAILVLGVSGGVFFPLFRLLSRWFGAAPLAVNVDGVEWRRTKFGWLRRAFLFASDRLAQRFAHGVIFDNEGLRSYIKAGTRALIPYSGDHVNAVATSIGPLRPMAGPYALTICRIEPENNCGLLIEGFLCSGLASYVFVGNWDASAYGRALRQRYWDEPRLKLLDPIYDPLQLHALRSNCTAYIHGHSVGGTNPSLVEMLFYDNRIACFACDFNRHTALDAVEYFRDETGLGALLDGTPRATPGSRATLRRRYSADSIAREIREFLGAIRGDGAGVGSLRP